MYVFKLCHLGIKTNFVCAEIINIQAINNNAIISNNNNKPDSTVRSLGRGSTWLNKALKIRTLYI